MNFVLSEEHTMARTLFRTFAENEVKPLAQELDEQERFPTETVEKMAAYGFWEFRFQRSGADKGRILLPMQSAWRN